MFVFVCFCFFLINKKKKREQEAQQKFEVWNKNKLIIQKAKRYLSYIPQPTGRRDLGIWEDVGKALKAVDRCLYGDWLKWSNKIRGTNESKRLWDSFSPICCDTHGPSNSVRETLLKFIQKKGVNFCRAFEMFDKDGGGCLSPKEFKLMMEQLGITLSRNDLRRVFSIFDKDGSGSILKEEFLKFTGEGRITP